MEEDVEYKIMQVLGENPIHVNVAEEEHVEYIADRAEKARKPQIIKEIENMVKKSTYSEIKNYIKAQRSDYLTTFNKTVAVSGELDKLSHKDEFETLCIAYYKLWHKRYQNSLEPSEFSHFLARMSKKLGHKIRYVNHMAIVLGYLCIKNKAVDQKRAEDALKLSKDQVGITDIVRYARLWLQILKD